MAQQGNTPPELDNWGSTMEHFGPRSKLDHLRQNYGKTRHFLRFSCP